MVWIVKYKESQVYLLHDAPFIECNECEILSWEII